MSWATNCLTSNSRKGRFPIDASTFGRDGTADRSRVPKPPTNRTAFIVFESLRIDECRGRVCFRRELDCEPLLKNYQAKQYLVVIILARLMLFEDPLNY
jgi:hypothetical protein